MLENSGLTVACDFYNYPAKTVLVVPEQNIAYSLSLQDEVRFGTHSTFKDKSREREREREPPVRRSQRSVSWVVVNVAYRGKVAISLQH